MEQHVAHGEHAILRQQVFADAENRSERERREGERKGGQEARHIDEESMHMK